MRIVIALLFALALTSCASFGPTKCLTANACSPGPGKHAISIERDTHFGYNKLPMRIYVDGAPIAEVLGGETINLYVADGRHIVGIDSGPAKEKPDMTLAVDVNAANQPILRASLCAIGYCGAKLERVETR
jgi:hypothetical protein